MLDDDDDFELNDELIAASNSFNHGTFSCNIMKFKKKKNYILDNSFEQKKIPCFNCTGEDTARSNFQRCGFIRTSIPLDISCDELKDYNIFDLNLNEDTLCSPDILRAMFNKARYYIL